LGVAARSLVRLCRDGARRKVQDTPSRMPERKPSAAITENLSQRLLPGVPLVESMLFPQIVDDMDLTATEREIAASLHERGFAVFDFPDDEIEARVERIKADLGPDFDFDNWRTVGWAANVSLRMQDAWKTHEDVRAIAANEQVTALLGKLYGRRAFPFQTLNFPVGTQQHFHSDSIHFSSVPERFMCGVWLAMEDIDPSAGPLVYYPGSHRWPIIQNEMIGKVVAGDNDFLAQEPYEEAWRALAETSGVQPELFMPKKGQALIWAANLLHGGSRQIDPQRTRWSQVTHYYFDDCVYYTPAYSDPMVGNLDMRRIVDISTGEVVPNIYVDRPVDDDPRRAIYRARSKLSKLTAKPAAPEDLPADFDAARYLALHSDVAQSGMDAQQHYLAHGREEARPYR
jgi:hypothetical protein